MDGDAGDHDPLTVAMLRQLSIRNFVLIDRLDIEFGPGLTALTGETGAGKSIVLDALGLVLGARADPSAVRVGERQAEITAEFEFMPKGPVAEWLRAQGETAEDGSVILRRVVDAGGRSRAQINGRPATAGELRELGRHLLELHAQHEQQALLETSAQRALVDRAANALPLVDQVREAHAAWREARQRLDRALAEHEAIERERRAIESDLESLRTLAPGAEEWSSLTAEQARLSHARELAESAANAHAALGGDEALIEQLDGLGARLRQVARFDERLLEGCARIDAARAELAEAEQFLRHYASRIDLDPDRLAEVDARMSALFTLSRRLKTRPEALAEHWQTLEARAGELAAAQDVARLEAAYEEARRVLASAAARLSERRAAAAPAYAERVNRDLDALALGRAAIEVRLEPEADFAAHGAERVEIFFRSHPSLPFAPLAKVASGGELARLSLALLVALGDASTHVSGSAPAGVDSGPVLIFDEVDVGVGGKVAAQVGRRLQQLASARQVIAVTHMPQVAAHADRHLLVSRDNASSPSTRIHLLDEAARVEEVARMLGGHEHTEATRQLASDLLRTSARRAG